MNRVNTYDQFADAYADKVQLSRHSNLTGLSPETEPRTKR